MPLQQHRRSNIALHGHALHTSHPCVRYAAGNVMLMQSTTACLLQIPYFNAPIFLENKTQVGKVEEVFGKIHGVVRYCAPKTLHGSAEQCTKIAVSRTCFAADSTVCSVPCAAVDARCLARAQCLRILKKCDNRICLRLGSPRWLKLFCRCSPSSFCLWSASCHSRKEQVHALLSVLHCDCATMCKSLEF
jgi:Gar1/Naf1 RNA binding region